MAKLANRYALALLNYADEIGQLDSIYKQALGFSEDRPDDIKEEPITEEVQAFIEFVLEAEVTPVMQRFVDIARDRLGIVNAVIISAAPLNDRQINDIKEKVEKKFNKTVEISTQIDESLLGGFRIMVDDMVIDYSVKRTLRQMKDKLYEGVNLA